MTRKFIPLRVFYARARQKHTAQDMMRRFSQALTPESAARDCLAVCENLIKGIVSKEVASGVGLSPANESVLKAQLSSFWQGHR